MIVNATSYSPMYGGANAVPSFAFDDAIGDLNTKHSISKIEFVTGWVVDAMRVTYNSESGLERKVVHGRFEEKANNHIVQIGADEYISKAEGLHGHPNGQYDYGDCIQKIRFVIKNSKTGEEKTTPYFGAAEALQNPQPFKWEGRLFSFAGRADNSRPQVGLQGLSFGEFTGKVVFAESIPYGGDRSSGLIGKEYNDLASYGAKLNLKNPIKSIVVWSGQVVDGLEITYNLSDGTTASVMHGAQGGGKTEVKLLATENIVEINGIYGTPAPLTNWDTQVQLLSFLIYNSATGLYRTTATFGTPNENFVAGSRKDIFVRGPLVGLAGTANNDVPMVGLNTVVFCTQCPA